MHTSVERRACWLGLLFVTGCGSSDSFPVEGTVKLDGKPLAGVTVQFIAQDPGGRDANGTADAEGVFRLSTTRPGDGVLPGKYKVVIQPARASARPAASMRRTGTWPSPPLYGPGHHDIWASLYDRFGLDIAPTLDRTQPDEHWERFLYFNAGWFFGADPALFGQRFRDWAVAVRDDPGEALACQSLDPWLDQIVLPLVIHSLGGGRPGPELAGMDGTVTCHWRRLSLLYARESDRAVAEIEALAALPEIAPLIDGWEAGERLIRAGLGRSRIRPMFAGARPLPPERAIRKRLRAEGLWLA